MCAERLQTGLAYPLAEEERASTVVCKVCGETPHLGDVKAYRAPILQWRFQIGERYCDSVSMSRRRSTFTAQFAVNRMADRDIYVNFVLEIEKCPVLYNYNLVEYSIKDVIARVWSD